MRLALALAAAFAASSASAATLTQIAPATSFTDTLALSGFERPARTACHSYGRCYDGAAFYDSSEALTVQGSIDVRGTIADFNLQDIADQPIGPFFSALFEVAGEVFSWNIFTRQSNAERFTLRLESDEPLGEVRYLFQTSGNGPGNAPGEVWEGDGWALNVSTPAAVPVPATFGLLAAALAGLGLLRRRNSRHVD